MPKRHGQLFERCFTPEAIYQAYLDARRSKRKTPSVQDFERDLGANLAQIHAEMHSGTYQVSPYRRFIIHEPKRREISAPAFRDRVVQHAIYSLVYPIFDRGFIHDSYGCRIGKGTHRAADQAQRFLRAVPADSYTLQIDVRRFYYRIDRDILRGLIERRIKDRRLVDLMMQFAEMEDPLGLPIGNLLSQLYGLIYLDPFDQFVKREMRARRYVRYVDDSILFGLERNEAHEHLRRIQDWLADNLSLELSKWTIAPVSRGVNFVGFRTWRSTRFPRKRSLYRFSRSLRRGDIASLNAIMGHALRTGSHRHFCRRICAERPDLIPQLPHYRSAS